ncbi:MAG: hypothetical protein ABJP02_05015 [Parasphingorhabdus sp.]|uniref:hypothetical protein n=1 Tax=Parasphingorhabdus sp. TaxID=2709688 RepID=UPI003298D7BE
MTGWEWYAGLEEDVECEGVYSVGGCETRDAAIAEAREQWPDKPIMVIEARMSTAKKHYVDPDIIPFTHTRNKELMGDDAA